MVRILALLSAVAQNCVDPSRRKAVKAQIDLIVRVAECELAEESDFAMVAGAAARATEVVERPGTLVPPPSASGRRPRRRRSPRATANLCVRIGDFAKQAQRFATTSTRLRR
jgi:hypothetical protein